MLSERGPGSKLMSSTHPPERRAVDLSAPIRFDGSQSALFGLPRAARAWARTEGFSGCVAQGASCNVETLTVTPHVHGTHTECVGHITRGRISLLDVWKPARLRALLVTAPEPEGGARPGISAAELAGTAANPAIAMLRGTAATALILRTRSPADRPRFLTEDAAAWIRTAGFSHLLIDAPSIDPMDDGGRLAAHRAFWGMAPGSVDPVAVTPGPDPLEMTITELLRIPDQLDDGWGWLDLHIPPFDSDAAPSRPLYYPDAPHDAPGK